VGGVKSSVSAIAVWFSFSYIVGVFTRITTPGEASQPDLQTNSSLLFSSYIISLRISEPKETFPGNPNYHNAETK